MEQVKLGFCTKPKRMKLQHEAVDTIEKLEKQETAGCTLALKPPFPFKPLHLSSCIPAFFGLTVWLTQKTSFIMITKQQYKTFRALMVPIG